MVDLQTTGQPHTLPCTLLRHINQMGCLNGGVCVILGVTSEALFCEFVTLISTVYTRSGGDGDVISVGGSTNRVASMQYCPL